MWLARRFAGEVSRRAALALFLLPLLFTGKAMARGELYGPADFYAGYVPWRGAAVSAGSRVVAASPPANPILSDLAFANIPWRAAVREAIANGRFPFWNRFVLGGNPLLAAAQAGIFHPSTWAGILLPLPLSWTFSCAFTLFLGLLAAYLFFRDLAVSETSALIGAAAWGLSTYLVFWNGWSVGPSTATFPLLLLGLRRIARRGRCGVTLTVTALLLSLAGGHPESFFHATAAAGVFFLAELFAVRRSNALRPLRNALGAGALAFLLAAPQLLPLLEAIPHTAEYRTRRAQVDAGAASQSVAALDSGRRLLPALLPFAHGIYGKSPVQAERADGSGMPLAYAGAILFPLAAAGLAGRRPGRGFFAACALAGLLLGASAPGLIDLLTLLPGFALSLNYRLVFLAAFGLAGLAALGAEDLARAGRAHDVAAASVVTCVALAAAAAAAVSRGLFRERGLPDAFVLSQLAFELVPVCLLAAAAFSWRRTPQRLAVAALVLLVVQRGLEMHAVYPTVPGDRLRASLPGSPAAKGGRFVASGDDLRPNGAALLGIEDVRGYESIVLDRFADTFPLWCVAQHASFNRVDDLTRPFLAFLGARFAVAAPGAATPAGWILHTRSDTAAVFENPRALPRAFVPRRVVSAKDSRAALEAMAAATDFSDAVWVRAESGVPRERRNPDARVSVRSSGPDLWIETDSPAPVLVATSIPDWPGWRAQDRQGPLELETVNHAFVGVRVPPGSRRIRLSYRPPSFLPGLAACAAGALGGGILALLARRRLPGAGRG